ncbi:MAG TPA: hypothetical protein PKA76_18220 [Pirellulaceae bacterium]|nr:hypothetical protein [Pirellulaceae bacterium]HMP71290.1 hypothetical protein [Pirellulaceae bacterium]
MTTILSHRVYTANWIASGISSWMFGQTGYSIPQMHVGNGDAASQDSGDGPCGAVVVLVGLQLDASKDAAKRNRRLARSTMAEIQPDRAGIGGVLLSSYQST